MSPCIFTSGTDSILPAYFADPANLIAALPAVMGYTAERSLILFGVKADKMAIAMRVDLTSALVDHVAEFAHDMARANIVAVNAVVVDECGVLCPLCSSDHRRLCEELAAALVAEKIELRGAHVVDVIAAGGQWRCLDGCGAVGDVPDPAISPLAIEALVAGRQVYDRRDDLRAVIAITDPTRTATLGKVIAGCANGVRAEAAVAAARAAAALLAANGDINDTRIAGLVLALEDGSARDALYGLAADPDAEPLGGLWAFLARTTPDPWRADVLVMVALHAYLRFDTPLVAAAVEAARAADPGNRMAGLLYEALRSGARPDKIGDVITAAQPR